jgi:hypothetical protein
MKISVGVSSKIFQFFFFGLFIEIFRYGLFEKFPATATVTVTVTCHVHSTYTVVINKVCTVVGMYGSYEW